MATNRQVDLEWTGDEFRRLYHEGHAALLEEAERQALEVARGRGYEAGDVLMIQVYSGGRAVRAFDAKFPG